MNFSIKDAINRALNPYDSKVNPYKFVLASLFAGGSAGSITMTFVYPLDFARTRLGVDMGKNAAER